MDTETETRETVAAFAERLGLRLQAHRNNRPSAAIVAEWKDPGARHWRCTLRNGAGGRYTFGYHQGSAHTEAPTLADCLDSLGSDASAYDNARGFEDFAADMGYDTDSRKAERTYRACGRVLAALRRLLGADECENLMYHTERL